ncbi:aKG-HExxH-type peptide beta-hydroxylase [Streptomyces sp. NBC_01198]|uniref:aKG-HExxH-type peptide beta-hydroxylase n=1 Tax=Streptomyces sp. NBC_01198 TaxID=2903769 RepID=UPI002E0FF816|nr:HEXXH motif-containing putative peptide modification protein [Streptomyces sp. NBC_01198]
MTIAVHELPAAELLQLAAGEGSRETAARLCDAERSKHILLLHAVIAETAQRFPAAHRELELAASWTALSIAQSYAPDTVAPVLAMPQLGAWAADCLLRLARSDGDSPELRACLADAGAFAAIACLRAGVDFDLLVASSDGVPALPVTGALTPAADGPARRAPAAVRGPVRLRGHGGRLELVTADVVLPVDRPRPITLTTRHAGLTLDLAVDCSTPSLDCPRHRRVESLDPVEIRRWAETLAGTWRILTRHHRADAEAISLVVRTLVPLMPEGSGSSVAATLPSAFGAVAASLPPDDLAMAETLVHELQHLKLCAVLELVPLIGEGEGEGEGDGAGPGPGPVSDDFFYAPWRDDPRPPAALLQGAYAFLGVTRFWRTQRRLLPAEQAVRGHAEFARRRAETLGVAENLLASGRLTAEGAGFVGEMARRLRAWRADEVPAEARRLGLSASFEHRTTWEVRHVLVDPAALHELAARWNARRPAALADRSWPPYRVRPADRRGLHPRSRLLTLRYADPARFRDLLGAENPSGTGALGLGPADAALLRDDLPAAAAGYLDALRRRPCGPEVWSGLALAVRGRRDDPAAAFLSRRVPLVSAVHTALHTASGETADPLALAGWLARGESGDVCGRYASSGGRSPGRTT